MKTRPNYGWWSYFRRGRSPGFELSSVFAEPIISIVAAWMLGDGFSFDIDDEPGADALNEMATERFSELMGWVKDSLALGDSYLVINPDGSFSFPSPDTVFVETDPEDYRKVAAITIITRREEVEISDRYTPEERIIIRKYNDERGEETETFRNPLIINDEPVLPIVKLSWGREANEIYGHPIYSPLLPLLLRYHDVLDRGLSGVELMGRPIPSIEGLKDPKAGARCECNR